jgi:hypothetical protein
MVTIYSPFCYLCYVHWHENELLYIGKGHGLTRPFERAHKMFMHRNEVTHSDIHQCKTEADALALEKELKYILGKPKYDEDEFARGGRKLHIKRMENIPEWALDEKRIQEILVAAFPNFKTDVNQAMSVVRWSNIIYWYYRLGWTEARIGKELNRSAGLVNSVMLRIRHTEKNLGKLRRKRGRPRKIN